MNYTRVAPTLFTAFTLLALSACAKSEPEPPAQSTTEQRQTSEINWLKGDVESAFALAKEQNKPVILYWGAKWCPPCNQLKATVFTREDFIKTTEQFVAVYLDGDSQGAQKWGEHFGAVGYPTLIVFQADGTELTRIVGGMDLALYPKVLKQAAAQNQPVGKLVQLAQNEPQKLSEDDWFMLAFYGWPIDMGRVLPDAQKAEVFAQFAQASAKHPELSNRFALLSAIEAVNGAESLDAAFSAAEQNKVQDLLNTLIKQPAQFNRNIEDLQYSGAKLLVASNASVELQNRFLEAMDNAFNNVALAPETRTMTLYPKLALWRIQNPDTPPSDTLQKAVLARAAWANENAKTPFDRQSQIYNAGGLLEEAGLNDEAKALYMAEIERSVSPHYFMSYISALERQQGNVEQALAWSKRAWDESTGPATRAQWGINYLNALMSLAPADVDKIEATASAVITELQQDPSAAFQRTRMRLQRLNTSMLAWAEENKASETVARLRTQMQTVCDSIDESSDAYSTCTEFLKQA